MNDDQRPKHKITMIETVCIDKKELQELRDKLNKFAESKRLLTHKEADLIDCIDNLLGKAGV